MRLTLSEELTEVNMDYVVLLGTRINRPERISRSVWLKYWEQVEKGIFDANSR
jgi:hypothetical protein